MARRAVKTEADVASISYQGPDTKAILALIGPDEDELAALPEGERQPVLKGATQLANLIWKTCYNRLRHRDMFVVIHHVHGNTHMYGPEASADSAEKWARKNLITGGQVVIHPMKGSSAFEVRQLAWKNADIAREAGEPPCEECGHRRWLHENWKANNKEKEARPAAAKAPCGTECPCPRYKEATA